MTDSMMKRCWVVVLVLAVVSLSACKNPQAQIPDRANFTAVVNDYLSKRGHLCLAKYDWPITVTAIEREARSSLNARQMPVLESLGLVNGREVPSTGAGKSPSREYALTAEGQKYYLHVPVVITAARQHVVHPADFCAATLTLDRLVGWEKPTSFGDRTATSILFTYRISPAAWTQTPDARLAFPTVTRAVANAGALQLRLGVHLTSSGWVADELSE